MHEYYVIWRYPTGNGSWVYCEPNRLRAALRAMRAEGWTSIEIVDIEMGGATRIEARP